MVDVVCGPPLSGEILSQPFQPDESLFFRSFEEEWDLVPIIGRQAKRISAPTSIDALFLAWCQVRGNDDAAVRVLIGGVSEFRQRFGRALEDTQTGIQSVLDKYLVDYRDRIDPVDEIGSCNDPELLFRFMDDGIDGGDHRLDRASRMEARRKLAIASQFVAIGAVDPFELVTSDLTWINLLARRKLFEPEDRVMRRVSFVLNPAAANHVVEDLNILVGSATHQSIPEGCVAREAVFSCRVAKDNGRTYYVQTHSRPKSRVSAVIKLERGGKLNDRRALRHVLVAIEEGGVTRAATVDDISSFVELARRKLWVDELIETPDTGGPNRFRDPNYRDKKIVGRYRQPGRSDFLPSVEHQVTYLTTHLNGEFATDHFSHFRYKQKIVWDVVLAKWWASDRYGIDWDRERKTS